MRNRRLVWIVGALAIAGALAGYWSSRSGGEPEITYETVAIDRGRIVARVTATGTLSALVTVQVGSQVSGRISEIHADFNDTVRKGQVLARLDINFFDAALNNAQANVKAAEGQLQKAKAQAVQAERALARSEGLATQGLLSDADLELARANSASARADVRVAEGNLAQARAALTQAQVNLGYTTIVSPIQGVVISRDVSVGQTVAASFQAPTLFTIAEDLSRMQVDTNVAEADIGKLRPGMAGSFTVDAFPGERFEGVVRQIRIAPQVVQNVVTYNAVIDVANLGLKLRPGMTANVTFVHAERETALRVPNAAVRFRAPEEWTRPADGQNGVSPEGAAHPDSARQVANTPPGDARRMSTDRRTIWVLRDGNHAAVEVRTGVTDGMYTEILEGDAREGDAAITDATGGGGGRSRMIPGLF